MIDEKKLQQFLGKMMIDLGAAISVPLVRIGVRLGLYKAMDGAGPMTSAEFAAKSNIAERYAREWLAQNAASGYLTYDPESRRFELPAEQAMVFAKEESPFFIGGGFDAVAAVYQTQPLIEEAFKSGGGVDWGDHAGCLFCAIGAMLRPRYSANIIQKWLPALDGVVSKLQMGAKVAVGKVERFAQSGEVDLRAGRQDAEGGHDAQARGCVDNKVDLGHGIISRTYG